MDVISILKEDHRAVDALFKRFEELGPRAQKSKQTTVEKILRELSIHAAVEEQVLYPFVREQLPEQESQVLESLEEHLVVKWECAALADMKAGDERFDAKVNVLMESVRHHVKEEEKQLFPALRAAVGRPELQELGEAVVRAKKTAPTRPHPLAPDTPPGNLVNAAAGMLDRARDVGRGAIERVTRAS